MDAVGRDQRDDVMCALRSATPVFGKGHRGAASDEPRRRGAARGGGHRGDDLRDTIFGAIANGDTNRRWRRPAAERRAHGIDCRRSGGAIMFAAPRDCAGIICGNRQDRVFANFNSENHGVVGIVSPGQSTCT